MNWISRLGRGLAATALGVGLTANGFAAARFKVIYSFQGAPDGAGIYGQLVFDVKGNIYGATAGGGTGNCNGGCGATRREISTARQ